MSEDRMAERILLLSSSKAHGPSYPQQMHPVQGETPMSHTFRTVHVWPFSSAPLAKLSARMAVEPPGLGHQHSSA